MMEKPIAHSVAAGREALEEYTRVHAPKGLLWAVLENFRFESGIVRAGVLAGDARLMGALALVEVRVHNPMPPTARFAAPGRTNQLIEGGCHFTASLRAVAEGGGGVGSNPVVTTVGVSSHRSEHMPAPDTLAASYSFRSGVLGSLVVSYAVNKRRFEIMATGTRGSVMLNRGVLDGKHGYRVVYEPHIEGEAALDEFYPFDGIPGAVGSFAATVALRKAGAAAELDERLSVAAAQVDIELVESML
jgi:predicted dehydrogenase